MSNINSPFCFNLLENTPSFIIIIDENQRIYWLNQSFCDFLGLEREHLIGMSDSDMKGPCLKEVLNAAVRVEVFAGILDKWIELQDVMVVNGEQFEQKKQKLTVCYYADVSEKIHAEKQLLQLESTLTHKMSHDAVTGMLNHYSMFQTLNVEVSRSRRYNNPLSVVLMNVEYLPASDSDAEGTLAHENISQEKIEQLRLMISQLLKDQMRWADIVGHLKDFDFVLLLPETVYESAEILVEKLNNSLKNAAKDVKHIRYGLSQWQKGDDVEMFLQRAVAELNSETA